MNEKASHERRVNIAKRGCLLKSLSIDNIEHQCNCYFCSFYILLNKRLRKLKCRVCSNKVRLFRMLYRMLYLFQH